MNRSQAYLAIGWSIFSMLYLGGVSFMPIPVGSENIVNTILGVIIGGVVSTILNFSFGSSQGSKDKDKLMGGSR